MISCFLLSEISSEHMKFKSLNIFLPLAVVCNHKELSTFVIYFKKGSALYQLSRVTLIGFMVRKCHPCPGWKAGAARKLVHCVCFQGTWDTCSETESSQDIYWSAIRLSMLLFLVLIELEAKWAQKETIKWLQLRSVINNAISHSKKQDKHSLVCSGGETWNSKNILFKFLSRLLQQAESEVCWGEFWRLFSLWHLQHSLEVPGEQREVCMHVAACTAGTHVDGQTTCGKIQWWSWLPMLDCECLWEDHISCFNLTRTSAKPVKMLVSGCSLTVPWFSFARYLSQWEDPITSWKLLTAFAEKCPNVPQNTFKRKHVWICLCVILLQLCTENSEAVMMSKWMFEFTSSLSNEMSGFNSSESLSLQKIVEVLSCD